MVLPRTSRRWFSIVSLSLAAGGGTALGACGGATGTDAGVAPDASTTTSDGGGGSSYVFPANLPATTVNDTVTAAAFGCRGTRTAPASTGAGTAMFSLEVFSMAGVFAPSTRVWFFADNEVRATCDTGVCQEFTTDANGRASAPLEVRSGGWYAYRVFARMGTSGGSTFLDSIQSNELADGAPLVGNAVAESTANLIPVILGYERAPGLTTLAGRVLDCNGTDVRGAVLRAFSGSTEITEAASTNVYDSHYIFFRETTGSTQPHQDTAFTSTDGLYAVINVPVGETVRIEAWGRVEAGAEPVRLGCETTTVLPDGVTILNIEPERGDYGSSPCATP